jgi:hypothetical protein
MIVYPRHPPAPAIGYATARAALKLGRPACGSLITTSADINRLVRYLVSPSRRKRRAAARPFGLLPLPETLSLILGPRFFITNTRTLPLRAKDLSFDTIV